MQIQLAAAFELFAQGRNRVHGLLEQGYDGVSEQDAASRAEMVVHGLHCLFSGLLSQETGRVVKLSPQIPFGRANVVLGL